MTWTNLLKNSQLLGQLLKFQVVNKNSGPKTFHFLYGFFVGTELVFVVKNLEYLTDVLCPECEPKKAQRHVQISRHGLIQFNYKIKLALGHVCSEFLCCLDGVGACDTSAIEQALT